jgi:hypothetical protein
MWRIPYLQVRLDLQRSLLSHRLWTWFWRIFLDLATLVLFLLLLLLCFCSSVLEPVLRDISRRIGMSRSTYRHSRKRQHSLHG